MAAAHFDFCPSPARSYAQATLPLFGLFGKRDDGAKRELHGQPDGPPLVLSNGIVVQRQQVDGARVTPDELLAAVAGIRRLPESDQRLIAQSSVPIALLPVAGLEDGLLGATTIVQQDKSSPWKPTLVRVAVRAGLERDESTPEILQHELGHVVSVLNGQDFSEQAAERYAQAY